MNKTISIISILISVLMLLQLFSCTQQKPDDTEVSKETAEDTETVTEEKVETNASDPALITDSEGKANVLLPSGVSYTATGYESAGSGIFRIKTGFEAVLDESIKGKFNRLLFHYTAS